MEISRKRWPRRLATEGSPSCCSGWGKIIDERLGCDEFLKRNEEEKEKDFSKDKKM